MFGIAFSPDGKTLAGGQISLVQMWDVSTGREICPIPEHRAGVGFVQLSPDGRIVTTEGQAIGGAGLRYWQARTGMQMAAPPEGEKTFPPLADLSADGKVLASWGEKNTILLFDVPTGKELNKIPFEGDEARCTLSPNGDLLVLRTRDPMRDVLKGDNRLQLWTVDTGKCLGMFEGHKGLVWTQQFSPDGKTLATLGYHDKTIRIWDVNTQKELLKFPTEKSAIFAIAFSRDAQTLAGAGNDEDIRLWDLKKGKELPRLSNNHVKEKLQSGVHALLFTPDGKTLIATDNHGKVFLWDLASGDLRVEWKAHQFRVTFLAMSDDGKVLLTKGATTALVWDIPEVLKGNHPK
jgi:WD40 repeat protein